MSKFKKWLDSPKPPLHDQRFFLYISVTISCYNGNKLAYHARHDSCLTSPGLFSPIVLELDLLCEYFCMMHFETYKLQFEPGDSVDLSYIHGGTLSAVTDFIHQNLMSVDVRFRHVKSIPTIKELNIDIKMRQK